MDTRLLGLTLSFRRWLLVSVPVEAQYKPPCASCCFSNHNLWSSVDHGRDGTEAEGIYTSSSSGATILPGRSDISDPKSELDNTSTFHRKSIYQNSNRLDDCCHTENCGNKEIPFAWWCEKRAFCLNSFQKDHRWWLSGDKSDASGAHHPERKSWQIESVAWTFCQGSAGN